MHNSAAQMCIRDSAVLVLWAAQIIPWITVSRCTFLYHYFPGAGFGVLAVQGDGGWPYAVPLNYACCGRSIYFHCAKAGHKLDALRAHPKVCFTVVDKSDIVSSEFTTYFSSVVAFGTAHMVEEHGARTAALRALVEKYSPREPEEHKAHEVESCGASCIVAIDVVHITGKQAIELVEK